MQLKASTDYGLRTVLYLALQNRVCSSKEISEQAAIPRDYLIQLAQQEREAGIIASRSGKNGGYVIAKPASEITLLDVLNAVDGTAEETSRTRRETMQTADTATAMCDAIDLVLSSYRTYLGSITLAMLVECSQNVSEAMGFLSRRLGEESDRLAQLTPSTPAAAA